MIVTINENYIYLTDISDIPFDILDKFKQHLTFHKSMKALLNESISGKLLSDIKNQCKETINIHILCGELKVGQRRPDYILGMVKK